MEKRKGVEEGGGEREKGREEGRDRGREEGRDGEKFTNLLKMLVKSPSVHSLVLGSITPYKSSLEMA